jgi:trans-2,3-dihydro-3-hydroxyanthranilate isomerase
VDFLQIDVFTDKPFQGNPLAVFADGAQLTAKQMQAVASEMNLSETTFVTDAADSTYRVRIFTPREELAFAGHPTIGTAFALLHLGRIEGDELVQESGLGRTALTRSGGLMWFERPGGSEADLGETDPQAEADLATALGIERAELGLEARELGRAGRLYPAFADAGLRQLMVPVRDLDALGRCVPPAGLGIESLGAYCFTATGAGRIRARGLWPGVGVTEDPATGSAAAALGLYLAERIGSIEFEIVQGVELGRRSLILVRAAPPTVRVGGSCRVVLRGRLEELP